MKKLKFVILICLVFIKSILLANNPSSGIYLIANDFTNNKISFNPVEGKKYKIILNEILNTSTIKIVIGDSTYSFNKDSIFGYVDNDNISYCFYQHKRYKLLNQNKNILLLTRTILGGYKNSQTITKYFFKANINAPILGLTKWNLKIAFPYDSTFHELLDMEFSSDNDLNYFDSFYETYKINRVYQFAKKLNLKLK